MSGVSEGIGLDEDVYKAIAKDTSTFDILTAEPKHH
jgi:hypothetical protein